MTVLYWTISHYTNEMTIPYHTIPTVVSDYTDMSRLVQLSHLISVAQRIPQYQIIVPILYRTMTIAIPMRRHHITPHYTAVYSTTTTR